MAACQTRSKIQNCTRWDQRMRTRSSTQDKQDWAVFVTIFFTLINVEPSQWEGNYSWRIGSLICGCKFKINCTRMIEILKKVTCGKIGEEMYAVLFRFYLSLETRFRSFVIGRFRFSTAAENLRRENSPAYVYFQKRKGGKYFFFLDSMQLSNKSRRKRG